MGFKYTKLQKAWLHDLKKTRAKQGKEFLHSRDGWCCLGRALHVMGVKPTGRTVFGEDIFEIQDAVLPEKRWRQLRLRGRCGLAKDRFEIDGCTYVELTDANDNGCTFKQIAAAIEADPSNFFTNGEKQ